MTSESRLDRDKVLGSSDRDEGTQNMSNLCLEQRENLRRCANDDVWPIGEYNPTWPLGVSIPGSNGECQDQCRDTPLQLRRDSARDVDDGDVVLAVLHQTSQMTENLFRKLASRHQNQRSRARS
jgi:hypothetical protein